MKKTFLIFALLLAFFAIGQNPTPFDSGIRPQRIVPRALTTTQIAALPTQATGTIVYNSTVGSWQYYTGSSWATFGGSIPDIDQVLGVGGVATDKILQLYDSASSKNSEVAPDAMFCNMVGGSAGFVGDEVFVGFNGSSSSNIPTVISLVRPGIRFKRDVFQTNLEFENPTGTTGKILFPNVGNTTKKLALVEDMTLQRILDTNNTANNSIILDEGAGGWNIQLNPAGYGITVTDTGSNSTSFMSDGISGAGNVANTKMAYFDTSTSDSRIILKSISSSGNANIVAPNLTANRTLTIPDASGTIALSSQLSSYANLNGSTSEDFQVPTIPSGANSAISRNYLDNALTGLTWKNAVKCSTTANHPLSGTSNVDGVTVPAGTRVLVRFQTAPAENGIYISASGAWTRATDADSASELSETTVLVTSGTLFKNTQWTQSNVIITVGTDAVTFVQVAGAGTYINGQGLALDANVFSIPNNGVTNAMLAGSISDSKINSASNWNTAFSNRITSLTTTGTSGPATLSGNVLNIPNYTTDLSAINAILDGLRTPIAIDQGNRTHTGTIAETIVASLRIPANTLNSVCNLFINYDFQKNTAQQVPIKVYRNATNAIGGSQIALYNTGSNRNVTFSRKFLVRNSTLDLLSTSTASLVTNINNDNSFVASETTSIDRTVDNWIVITATLDNTASNVVTKSMTIEKQKL